MGITPQTGTAEVNGARLYYESRGTGDALLLLHTEITDHRLWDDQVDVFAERYQVITVDLRGYGKSAMVPGTFAHYRDVDALLTFLGIERAVLVGAMLGGCVALDFALQAPERARALVLMSTLPRGYEMTGAPPAQWGAIALAYRSKDFNKVAELEMQIKVDGPNRTPKQVNPAVRKKVREMYLPVLRAQAHKLGNEEALRPPQLYRLGEIRCPTLMMVGDQSDNQLLKGADRMLKDIAGSEKVVIANVGQMVNLEEPEGFNVAVLEFLNKLT